MHRPCSNNGGRFRNRGRSWADHPGSPPSVTSPKEAFRLAKIFERVNLVPTLVVKENRVEREISFCYHFRENSLVVFVHTSSRNVTFQPLFDAMPGPSRKAVHVNRLVGEFIWKLISATHVKTCHSARMIQRNRCRSSRRLIFWQNSRSTFRRRARI